MHRHNRPGDHPAAGHLQVPTRRELDLRCVIQEFLLHSVVKFLPTMVRERSHIVENQAIVLGVELRRSVRRSRAPSLAIAVDELTKGGIFRASAAPVLASATYSRQRHRSAFLWTGLPIDAVIPYLLAAQERKCAGKMSQRLPL